VVIATGFWFLSALSKEYAGQMSLPVAYTHIPTDKVLSNRLVDTLDVEVRTSGFKLLMYRLFGKTETIRIDMRTARHTRDEGYYYIATNTRLERFSEQLGAGTRLTKVIPDTIYFNFNKKASKKVPVRLNSSISYKPEYQLKDSILIDPATVTVSGEPSVISRINFILTEKLVLKNVDENISQRIKLEPGSFRNQVELSISSVRVEAPVAKFTEGSIELPIEVINLPPGYNIRTFPDRAVVKYQVALTDFESIKPQMFAIVADYSKVTKDSGTKLKIELVKSPANVRHARITPDKVEFIVRK
jgi:YbbR domain-containing protein